MYEKITMERLTAYQDMVREYDFLLDKKAKIIKKTNTLQAVDYSKDRVQSGNGQKTTQPEMYAIQLEKINNRISELEPKLKSEHEELKMQIARIKKWNFRKVLVLRYLEKWKWNEIIQEFFWQEDDYDEAKDFKYKDKILFWHRQALEQLQKVSDKPFIKIEKQLHF